MVFDFFAPCFAVLLFYIDISYIYGQAYTVSMSPEVLVLHLCHVNQISLSCINGPEWLPTIISKIWEGNEIDKEQEWNGIWKSEKMQDIGMEMGTAMLWGIGREWKRKKERGISYARLLIVEWKGKVSRREKSGVGMEWNASGKKWKWNVGGNKLSKLGVAIASHPKLSITDWPTDPLKMECQWIKDARLEIVSGRD